MMLAALVAAAQANVLVDPGFEAQPPGTVTVDNLNPGEWVSFNGNFAIVDASTGVVRSGSQSVMVGVKDMPNAAGDKYSNFRQLYAADPVPDAIENKTWTASAWIYYDAANGAATDTMMFGFRANDSWNTNVTEAMLTILGSDLISGQWNFVEASVEVPEANIDLSDPDYDNKIKRFANLMVVQNGWVGQSGVFYVDDASLTVVPEPATMVLLGLGGLMSLRRRRG